MVVTTSAIAAGAGLYNVISDMFNTSKKIVDNGVRIPLDDAYHAKSLTQRAKQCFIESRAWIDRSIEHEKIVRPLLSFTLNLQTSLIFAALGLDGMVESGVTVSDKLRSIASEDYIDTAAIFKKDSIGLESLDVIDFKQSKPTKASISAESSELEITIRNKQSALYKLEQAALKEKANLEKKKEELSLKLTEEKDQYKIRALQTTLDDVDKRLKEISEKEATIDKDNNRLNRISHADITPKLDVSLPVGKVLEITLNGPNKTEYKVPIFVRLNPYQVDPELLGYLLETTGSSITSDKRQLMLKAGEISYWKDYIFGMDQMDRMRKMLARDKKGEFAQYVAMNTNKDAARMWQTMHAMADKAYKTSSNLANSVLIFSEGAVRDGELRGGPKLSNYAERQRFFDKNYAAIIYVIDPSHETVTMYLNGFSDAGYYSYNDFIKKKDLEGEDFMSVLRTISSGNISRF